jgi:hypothetical protein
MSIKLPKTSFFFGQILNLKRHFFFLIRSEDKGHTSAYALSPESDPLPSPMDPGRGRTLRNRRRAYTRSPLSPHVLGFSRAQDDPQTVVLCSFLARVRQRLARPREGEP